MALEKGNVVVVYQVRKPVCMLVEGVLMEWEVPAALLSSIYPLSPHHQCLSVVGHRLQDELPALLGLAPTWDGDLLGSAAQWEGCAHTKPSSSHPSCTQQLDLWGVTPLLESAGLGCSSGA